MAVAEQQRVLVCCCRHLFLFFYFHNLFLFLSIFIYIEPRRRLPPGFGSPGGRRATISLFFYFY
jgi:hypothetical protein